MFDANVTNQGRLEVAGGAMAFSGDLTLAIGSVLAVELSADLLLGSSTPALNAGGELGLGGRLEVALADGFVPQFNDAFVIAAASAATGQFADYELPPLPAGQFWGIDAVGGLLTLTVRDGAPGGDFNFDGAVNGRDFLAWQREASPGAGGASDLASWQSTYGQSASASPAIAAPEPAAATLAIAALIALTRLRVSYDARRRES
ncbi:MAG: hypothetical protein KDA44_13140 [Planctomycetales bacterium]|nr:hypothetical protein [Planctomycetales bacterium]